MITSAFDFSYVGSCHCGAIGFTYHTQRDPATWSVRACQCSFCRAHSAVTTSDPAGRIEFREAVAGALNRYRFGQRATDFLLCRTCGVYVGASIETPKGRFGVINIRALRPMPIELAAAVPVEYGAESLEQRIDRRERHWSPVSGGG